MVNNITTTYRKVVSKIQKLRYKRSLKKAVKHATHVKNTTGLKCFVLWFPGGYRAVTKQAVKQLHRQRYFKKGVTVQDIENRAVHVTN